VTVGRPEKAPVAVVGAGPAGLAAAIEAASAGARTVVLDESTQPGGQLHKQIHRFFGSREHQAGTRGLVIAERLRQQAAGAGAEVRLATTVWGAFPPEDAPGGSGALLGCATADGRGYHVRAQRVVFATGATERGLVFTGWTLPGAMGAGAAPTLTNIHRVLPGVPWARQIMAPARRCRGGTGRDDMPWSAHAAGVPCADGGAGNVGLIVAYQLLQAGAEVVAVVEAADRIGGYDVHAAKLRRLGVPILLGRQIVWTEGSDTVERAIVAPGGAATAEPGSPSAPASERAFGVDLICLAVGLSPQVELADMLGAGLRYRPDQGDHFPACDERLETTVPGVYVAGDLSGIGEATVAPEQGRIAGTAAAQSLGFLTEEQASARVAAAQQGLAAVCGMGPFVPLPGTSALPPPGCTLPVVECAQRIPCNPCEEACPTGATTVGADITAPPCVTPERCNGCGRCVRACPGQAVFLVARLAAGDEVLLTMAWELLPLPQPGQSVTATDREGRAVCAARVVTVRAPRRPGDTPTVTLALPCGAAGKARSWRATEAAG